jgi:hypothetical protein
LRNTSGPGSPETRKGAHNSTFFNLAGPVFRDSLSRMSTSASNHHPVEREGLEAPAYEAPTIADYGSLRELTGAASNVVTHFDATYPIGTTFPTPFT